MKTLIILTALLLFSAPAYAADKWTEADTQRQVIYSALHIIDWGQTRYIATHDEFEERNIALGKHPSTQEVDNYFAATLVGHTLVSYLLPSDWRKVWQYVFIGARFKTVADNYSIGIKVHF